MDNLRFALLCALGVLGFFLYQAWEADYADQRRAAESTPAESVNRSADNDLPDISDAPTQAPDESSPAREPGADRAAAGLASGSTVRVITDTLDVVIDTQGGDIRRMRLIGVPVSGEDDSDLVLLNDEAPNFFIAQSGLLVESGDAPDHRATYRSDRDRYELGPNQDTLEVPLTWTGADGREVTKVYRFERGHYRIGLTHEVRNNGGQAWTVSPYARLWRTPFDHGQEAPFAYSFTGVGWHEAKADADGYRFEKVAAEDLPEEPLKQRQEGGWVSVMQHYFLGAIIPPAGESVSLYAKAKAVPGSTAPGFEAGYVGAQRVVEPGQRTTISTELFLGPKLQDRLEDVAPGLVLTVDYGIFTFLSSPLFWVLEKLHDLVGNWGWSIVLLTVLIKLAFYKLSETQFRAMARMRKFAPRMQQLKEQYGDDRQKLQEKMMDLYKKEGFNPLGGCWPLLVQMPVFIALYWVLHESVELRHADFMLWINDLSSPDPYYILPIAFGLTMFAQQKLSASSMTMDPMQQRMMQIMPIALSVFFAFFPAGLVVYWFTNNLLSIGQQWYIYRKLDKEGLGQASG
ncbi:membrane protein insertase YidC [Spectribacter hydrogenoxidans]|uniref:Membrane protein insertase YidC n=1 Tax=Spectribacter hydrogenoxidans TaxID=3075608 RepID=A0ABU3BWC8_9GAMM|nr:membrane protein insertase YidC [Salinisphaera sp. W335]MDT0633577.1 membrane protein insertase YidC [Salinisphaera sp. W335]